MKNENGKKNKSVLIISLLLAVIMSLSVVAFLWFKGCQGNESSYLQFEETPISIPNKTHEVFVGTTV